MKNPLLQQTPYTNGVFMYNYVLDFAKKIKQKHYEHRKSDMLVF